MYIRVAGDYYDGGNNTADSDGDGYDGCETDASDAGSAPDYDVRSGHSFGIPAEHLKSQDQMHPVREKRVSGHL